MPLLEIEYQRLLAVFRRAALFVAPIASIGMAGCGPCSQSDQIFLLRDPDAATQLLIDECRDPVQPNCLPLCQHVTGIPNEGFVHCEMHPDRDGYLAVHVGTQRSCPGGRRPARLTLRPTPAPTRSRTGTWFADLFQLEAASVPAFRTLRDDLIGEDASPVLVREATAAARDEVRHARLTAALARRYGGRPCLPGVLPTPPRSLEAVAEENIIEGCVREAYGALVATVQARTSRDPVVRAVMEGVSRDETRHAALALTIDHWAAARLEAKARQRLADARQASIAELEATVDADWTPELGAVAGLPDPATSRRLLAQLRRDLWA